MRYWARIGLVRPTGEPARNGRHYAFRDLVALRLVRSLLDAGLPLQRVRRAVEYLQGTPTLSDRDLAGLRLVTDGTTVFACRDDGEVLDALRSGQLALFLSVDAVAAEVDAEVRSFREDRAAFVDSLKNDEAPPASSAPTRRRS